MQAADAMPEDALPRRPDSLLGRALPGIIVVVALAASYIPNFANLIEQWNNPNYSHGYLVPAIALAILWQRRDELDRERLKPARWAWPLLVGLLAARAWLYERNELWFENATLLPMLAALALAFGGRHLLRWALPAILFLAFMLPLPSSLNQMLAGPLQRLATIGSTALLDALGQPVLAEGNVIYIGGSRLEVAQACNGLSMLLSFVMLVTAVVIFLGRDRSLPERVMLLLSSIPIALLTNILRITATALAYQSLGAERGERIAHDLAGWAMMPVALAMIWLELKLVSWVLIVEDREDKFVVPTTYSAPTLPPKKPKGL